MSKSRIWTRILAGSLLLAAWLWASEVNIAPDAVTRATQGYNTYAGELTFLTDGLHPDNSEQAGVFAWPTKGNLIFQFEAPCPIAGLRLYVGADAGAYSAIAYLGVRFGESGQTETGDGTTMVADAYNIDQQPDTWVELAFPPETQTDYIELITESGAEFYEIEILSASEPTAVQAVSWGQIKRR